MFLAMTEEVAWSNTMIHSLHDAKDDTVLRLGSLAFGSRVVMCMGYR
jgi:hypothetical protein